MNRLQPGLHGALVAFLLGVVLMGCSDSQGRVDEPAVVATIPSTTVSSFPKGDFRSP
ncbi:MAG: hypothetical protein RKO66_03025 [Candidatus Contendobacter sp.]|nr:hypothetical protein [Candidatus Contendobacter sp.]MDS4059431.1 hypothetical protein [Candidatus Contendobacter sp.]